MKQIYRFDHKSPPYRNERLLREELARRTVRRQIMLLAVGILLSCICLIAAAFACFRISPILTFLCLAYWCTAVIGSVLMVLVVMKRKGACNVL